MAESRASFVRPPASSGRPLGGLLKDIYGAKLGLLADMAKSPEKEWGLLKQALGGNRQASDEWMRQAMQSPFMGFGVGNIKAYHGSPHAFGKFSTKHIGKGEGAQAYGHGLYFAENPKVAKSYQTRLQQPAPVIKLSSGKSLGNRKTAYKEGDMTHWAAERIALRAREKFNGNIKAAARDFIEEKKSGLNDPLPADPQARVLIEAGRKNTRTAIDTAQRILDDPRPRFADAGRLYEVNIKPDPPDFLDWDKPLSQQSEKVRKFIENHPQARRLTGNDVVRGELTEPTGEAILGRLGRNEEASQALRKAGIRGIKYKDAGSRGKGEGTSNFVVFDDADVEIKGLLD